MGNSVHLITPNAILRRLCELSTAMAMLHIFVLTVIKTVCDVSATISYSDSRRVLDGKKYNFGFTE